EYISKNNNLKCKTLFATHYHELTKLEGIIEGVKNYSVAVKETDEQVIFLRKIVEGGADQSYGIEVAKLAGLPLEVIDRAKHILAKLEDEKSIEIDKLFNNYTNTEKELESAVAKEVKSTIVEIKEEVIIEPVIEEKVIEEIKTDNTPINIKENTEVLQMDFTMLEKEALLTKIADIEVMTMTPLDAMNMLFKIVQDAKKLK
ncbi:MAG: DNA mismatch repair protein MutS, partial [Peptostreptococcaceae bacterium]|nr:DNA mismatch repair protein MutS [Peptostreptococcaceae bacterium]